MNSNNILQIVSEKLLLLTWLATIMNLIYLICIRRIILDGRVTEQKLVGLIRDAARVF